MHAKVNNELFTLFTILMATNLYSAKIKILKVDALSNGLTNCSKTDGNGQLFHYPIEPVENECSSFKTNQ